MWQMKCRPCGGGDPHDMLTAGFRSTGPAAELARAADDDYAWRQMEALKK